MTSRRPAYSDASTTSLIAPGSPPSHGSWSDFEDTPYTAGTGRRSGAISARFSLPPDPRMWGSSLVPEQLEADDAVHNPTFKDGRFVEDPNFSVSKRGLANIGCLGLLLIGLLALFIGYPVITAIRRTNQALTGFNLGGINASGQIPDMGNFGLIDHDTPQEAYTTQDWRNGKSWQLVFSDEFNTDGRTFYPGDDPYWEAVDLHYWATNDLEWYDPAAITTQGGSLVITFSQKDTHGLNYQGGMMSTWNKFCFTGGYVEASVQLPGANNVAGMWPAVWAMGNLGRAGYGASLEGMWPYSYDACDVGTAPNQTINGQPEAALTGGIDSAGDPGALSFLPGQKLSRCTCKGESHPGPVHSDGTYVGRSAPEIDMFEAQITDDSGFVSQSAQWAPFNHGYIWLNTSDNEIIPDPSITQQNTYIGGDLQQATSVVTQTDQSCYELSGGCYSVYGFQYQPGFDDGYISWISDNKVAWTLNAAGMAADSIVNISARPVSQEPMYLIMNLGMSPGFSTPDLADLTFPNHMRVDYIRVYQDPDNINIGCDPKDFPTEAYINQYMEAYTNPNLTTWRDDFGQPFPKNSLLDSC